MKLTRQLSQMRGAAMKIGQMISMDSGDFLPKEFAEILARLKDSIDSDVKNVAANVAALLRMSGLVPASLNVAPIIEEGRKQLHQEADYEREAAYLGRFAKLLKKHKSFEVPQYYPNISTDKVLAMSFHESIPIDYSNLN